jgi:predicted alpha/beta superfamily hydrolase
VRHTKARLFTALALLLLCATNAPAQNRELTKEFRLFVNFNSAHVKYKRDILVWLPPGYEAEKERRYPVLYMHDGDSVFVNWRIDEIARPLIESKQIEPLIIVMVPNGGSQDARLEEYTPTRSGGAGGKADAYGRMLSEELKPFIDSEFRTLTDAADTGLGGASLGALASLHLGLKLPNVFGRLAVMSPSVWWDDRVLTRRVKSLEAKTTARIWLDVGSEEGRPAVEGVRELRDALVRKGWALDADLAYTEARGAEHEEQAFARRAGPMLKFLFPFKKVETAAPSKAGAGRD